MSKLIQPYQTFTSSNPKIYTQTEIRRWQEEQNHTWSCRIWGSLFSHRLSLRRLQENPCKQRHWKVLNFLISEESRGEETNLGVDHKTLKPQFVCRPSAIYHRRQLHERMVDVYNRNARAWSSQPFLLRNWGPTEKKWSEGLRWALSLSAFYLLWGEKNGNNNKYKNFAPFSTYVNVLRAV